MLHESKRKSLHKMYLAFFSFLSLLLSSANGQPGHNTFYITGLFPTGSSDLRVKNELGIYPRAAAQYTVQRVNDLGLLADHNVTLKLESFNSGCRDIASGAHGLIQAVQFAKNRGLHDTSAGSKYAILGPACNEGTALTASLTSNYFHLVQVSYSADTPLVSNIDFPMFYRTVPSYLSYHATITSIMHYFDWLEVGIIHEEVPSYTVALETLNTYFQNNIPGAKFVATQGVYSHLDLERTPEARIFIVFAPEKLAPAIMCAAFHLGMTGPQYQWILIGNYEENWWKQKSVLALGPLFHQKVYCTVQDMQRAIESSLILTQDRKLEGMSRAAQMIQGGLTREEFWSEFIDFFNATDFNIDRATWVPTTYDAVWSIALALNKLLTTASIVNANGNTMNQSGLSTQLSSAMETLDFQGASGRVRFTSNRHSQYPPATHILQMQNGKIVFIGLHYEGNDTLSLNGNLMWQRATGPPRDRPKISLETVEIYLVCIMLVLVSAGIVLCGVMAVINCYYRKHKVIKASSPCINFLIIIGCAMGFASVVFISVENIDFHLDITPNAYPFLCNIRPWFLSLGYTLAFGALFAKTWRIYCIFKNPWRKNRPLKDRVLIAMVCSMLGVDIFVLVLWLVIDPLNIYDFIVDTDVESFTQELHRVCSDSNVLDIASADFTIWIIIIMAMKGFLLLFGLFLVSQTSKIKAKIFQDAKYIAIAIYGVGICCTVGVPTALVLMYKLKEDTGYFIATATITFCSYLILFMVFIPKIVLLRKYKDKVPTAVLLGLNPSFKVRSRAQYFANKKNRTLPTFAKQKLCEEIRTKNIEGESPVSILDTDSQADLLHYSNKAISCSQIILEGWEDAVDSTDVGNTLDIHEREIEFEGISYIASVAIDKDQYLDKSSTDQARSVGVLHKEPVIIEGQSNRTVQVEGASSTLRSCSYFSMDYTTTCVVEVHEDN